MPLKSGKSSHSPNMKKMMDEYKQSGMIGRTKPKSMKHAMEIANGIAYSKETKRGKSKKK